jgi:acetyl-CoA carboxylase carboxyltransferase component
MLNAIIDLRTPRFLLLVRNAFGGAYASYNNYPTGADLVIALPTTRVAVMGPAGVDFVYKDELRAIRSSVAARVATAEKEHLVNGVNKVETRTMTEQSVANWVKQEEAVLTARYERELMNPNEALSLGSISQIVMPSDLRKVLAENMAFHLAHYEAEPLNAVQREFF